MTTHNLKCWPRPFQALHDGVKTFEWRLNDRDYEVGDILHLCEWDPESGEQGNYTNRELKVVVTYILRGGKFGMPKKYVVMSVKPV
jgi:ParB family chromosome partitioning protein